MARRILLLTMLALLLWLGSHPPAVAPPADRAELIPSLELDGVYCTPDEIAGYSGTTLELRQGRFRYWFYSDVSFGPNEYPVVGTFTEVRGHLTLHGRGFIESEWTKETIKGYPVLLRHDALRAWRKDRQIYDYGVLMKTRFATVPVDRELPRPSVTRLYLQGDRKTWRDPFLHGPQ